MNGFVVQLKVNVNQYLKLFWIAAINVSIDTTQTILRKYLKGRFTRSNFWSQLSLKSWSAEGLEIQYVEQSYWTSNIKKE